MSRSASGFLSLFLLGVLLPACGSDEPSGPARPSGPAPLVEFDVTFGEPPLVGTLRVTPSPATLGWRYRIDPPVLGGEPLEGILAGPVSIPYRLETLGSHRVRVELTGPEGVVAIHKRLVVTDPASDFEVLNLLPVEDLWPHAGSSLHPEGIHLDATGQALYVADYGAGEVVRVDAGTFDHAPAFSLPPSVEGLAVTPSGSRLLAAHKYSLLSVVSLANPAVKWLVHGVGESFLGVLDESHVLVSGFPLVMVDLERSAGIGDDSQRAIEHQADGFRAGHFVIDRVSDPFGAGEFPVGHAHQVFVANRSSRSIEVIGLPQLGTIRTLGLDGLDPSQVALDPHDADKLYVMARDDGGQGWFLVLDAVSGTRLATVFVGAGACSGYCVANPVATFARGRYVAFEQTNSVLVVDTATDLPRLRFGSPPAGVVGGPAGVAASHDSDILYVLGGPYDALTKIRLRTP